MKQLPAAAAAAVWGVAVARAQVAPQTLPVREVTVFKDGHAFFLHQGEMPLDAQTKTVTLDFLPVPVLGTFWPFSLNKNLPLRSVTAGRSRVPVEKTAASMRDLLRANIGKTVIVSENQARIGDPTAPLPYEAVIVDLPTRTPQEVEADEIEQQRRRRENSFSYGGGGSSEHDNTVLLRTKEGLRVTGLGRISDVTFKNADHKDVAHTVRREEWRPRMTLLLDTPKNAPTPPRASVGMMYLQKGLRWIPSYKIALGSGNQAAVALQATLLNEVTDLENVSANFVIGVPRFVFADTPDPSGLVDVIARLGPFFDAESRSLWNQAIAGQGGGFGGSFGGGQGTGQQQPAKEALAADIAEAGRTEDLFVFRAKNVSLRKGERLVLPLAQYTLPFRNVYTLDLPITRARYAPDDARRRDEEELARQSEAPRVVHKIRLSNTSPHPLTTAPVLLTSPLGQPLAQNLLRYAPAGADTDVPVTDAIDIVYDKQELELKQTRDALQVPLSWGGTAVFTRVNFSGTITVTNRSNREVDLEVARYVLGVTGTLEPAGQSRRVTRTGEGDVGFTQAGVYASADPANVNHLNRLFWRQTLKPGESGTFTYAWHFWVRQN